MAATESEIAAQLIERLLIDPAFRARFRRDPAAACHEAGLERLAEEMRLGAGKAMHTLDARESRSSLAGVMMAAAMEGMGIYEFSKHVVPHLEDLPASVGDVLSRVNLPSLPEGGALAAPPAPSSAAAVTPAAEEAPVANNAAPPRSPEVVAAKPEPVKKDEPGGAPKASKGGPDAEAAPAPKAERAAAAPEVAAAAPEVAAAAPEPAVRAAAEPAVAAEPARVAAAPIDPAQFGQDGTGGPPDAQARALLENPNVVLDEVGVADIKAGRIDPRIVGVLTKLSQEHDIVVSCMCSDHSKFTAGGSISNHAFGRGLDIASIDGEIVSPGSPLAREVASELSQLDPAIRPDEIGSPFAINGPGYFTDAAHSNHIHVGFKQPITPDFKLPGELAAGTPAPATPGAAAAAGGAGLAPAGPAPVTPEEGSGVFAALGAPAKLAAATPTPAIDSGVFAALDTPTNPNPAAAAAPETPAVPAAPETPDAPETAAARAETTADAPPPAMAQGPGPKARAALAEARKYTGTAYKWGGSTPETGFDCSGLVQWAYAQAGVTIPRVTHEQIEAPGGTAVRRDELLPGDLVFFRDPSGYVYHVGMSIGGDEFLHAPRTGDVVKVASLDEPYYSQRFTGGRRFDAPATAGAAPAPEQAPAPAVDPVAVAAAKAAVERDAAEARRQGSGLFKAINAQEARNHARDRGDRAVASAADAAELPSESAVFLEAVKPRPVASEAPAPAGAAPAEVAPAEAAAAAAPAASGPPPDLSAVPADYPGDDAGKAALAKWLAKEAEQAGLPPELPVMAALVESGVANLRYGHADSVGFFQMRASIWDRGEYAGYPENPGLQAKWFIDTALAHKRSRIAAGDTDFGKDPGSWGEWIADVERPAEQYRGRYQLRLEEARRLLR